MRARLAVLVGLGLGVLSVQGQADGFQISFTAGGRDEAGRFIGGTELRVLAGHDGRLYAGNGYWQDRPGPEGAQGAQILVLDNPSGRWRVDHAFGERMANGRPRDLAVGALDEISFATDAMGTVLPRKAALLIASTWDLTGTARVFTRDDATGRWNAANLAQDTPAPDFLPQIRSFAGHRDRVTGADLVFAGHSPRGIYSGSCDPIAPGSVNWNSLPELNTASVASGFPGLGGRLRVSSFAEANGRLYAAIGQQIYERTDGKSPGWRLVYTNPRPGHSETGLRGLTTIQGAAGDMLLAAVEGDAARTVRIDPRDGSETTELDLVDFLSRSWGMRAGYTIAAYNDMTKVGGAVMLGLMAFIPRGTPIPTGHGVADVGYGQVESGGWYLVRWPDGRYDLRRVAVDFGHPLVAARTIFASPFANDAAVYFGGYDANKAPAHDTAWIARAPLTTALGAPN